MTVHAEAREVVTAAPDHELVWGAALDRPQGGERLDARSVPIMGWLLSRDGPSIGVEVLIAGRVVARGPTGYPRQDLADVFPDVDDASAAGFRLTLNVLAATSALAFDVRAVLSGQERMSLGSFTLHPAWREGMGPERPPLVSVVIPCRDHGRYLDEAIESVLAQTYDHLEIVVVDDGSRDNTRAVAAGYPGVKCLPREHAGVAAARNAGVRASTGEYVVFLDADDRLRPDALAVGARWLDRHPEHAFAGGRWEVIDSEGSVVERPDQPPLGSDAYDTLLRYYNFVMIGATIYRRDALIAAGGFDSALRGCEDYDLMMRIAARRRVGWHGATVAQYRRHGRNTTRDAALMLEAAMAVLRNGREQVAASPAQRASYRAGRAARAEHFGPPAVAEVRARAAEGRWRDALRGVRAIARNYPQGLGLGPRGLLGQVLDARTRPARPPSDPPRAPHAVDFGSLRRLTPMSPVRGLDRGRPVDRYYIERFLARHASDVRGAVLEIGDDTYTRRFGGDRVTRSDVLHVDPDSPHATLTGDLADGEGLPSEAFDCIILTQTLQLIYDSRAALRTVHRMLRPDGVLLATVPGLTQTTGDAWHASYFWRFTPLSARRLLEDVFPPEHVDVAAHGNVLAATSFLHGLAAHELRREELDHFDPGYDVSITMRAVRPPGDDRG